MPSIPPRLIPWLLGFLLAVGFSALAGGGQAAALPAFSLVQVGLLHEDARHVALAGDRVYFASQGQPGEDDRLMAASVADARSPYLLGAYETARGLKSVAVAGRYAYLANGYQGMIILDVSDPAGMVEVGRAHDVQYAADVMIVGEMAYVLEGNGALRIFDVSDPARPRQMGLSKAPDEFEGVALAVSGNYAYIASVGRGVRIVDISDPNHPFSIGYYDPAGPDLAQDVVVAGDYAYIAEKSIFDLTGSLRTLDISNPRTPLEIGSYLVDNPAQGVAYADGRVYLAHEAGGITVFDVSNPASPAPLASYNTSGRAVDIALGRGAVFLADAEGGLLTFHFLSPDIFLPQVHLASSTLDAGVFHLIQ